MAVSFPTPVLAPVTMTTLPDKSGMSSTLNLDLGGKDWEYMDATIPIVEYEICGLKLGVWLV